MRHAPGRVDDSPRVRRPARERADRARSSACTASSRRAPRSVRRTRSSGRATASCSPHAKPRCIACGNCVVACPFGVPEVYEDRKIMMKCDMCYDRTSVGKKPMCATVCPSQALFFGTREQIEQLRPLSDAGQHLPVRQPDDHDAGARDGASHAGDAARRHVDVVAAMDEQPRSRAVSLKVISTDRERSGGLPDTIRSPGSRCSDG